jgi:hypothetical protein
MLSHLLLVVGLLTGTVPALSFWLQQNKLESDLVKNPLVEQLNKLFITHF